MTDDESPNLTGQAEPNDAGPEAPAGAESPRPRRAARTRSGVRTPARTPHPGPRTPGLPTSPSARQRRLILALAVLGLIVVAIAYAAWSTLYRVESRVTPGAQVTVVVAKGASSADVADKLASLGVVDNATMFRVQAQLMGATGDMKAGTYTFVTGAGYEGVIRRLQAGPPAIPTFKLTIPEGWGIEKTAQRVQNVCGIPADEFIALATTGAKRFKYAFLNDNPTDTLEGYLFPKTYTVKKGAKAADVIKMMLAQYGEETAGLDYSHAESKGISPHQALTIASIIEREASVPADRPKVASVIYNRLAINMRLQLDSTVQYALHGKVTLTLDDLKTDSPYNTYQNAGVPPGPICSPGIVAIKAALAPAKTKYLYYILTHKDGRQSFATNYADFLELKAQFKRGLK